MEGYNPNASGSGAGIEYGVVGRASVVPVGAFNLDNQDTWAELANSGGEGIRTNGSSLAGMFWNNVYISGRTDGYTLSLRTQSEAGSGRTLNAYHETVGSVGQMINIQRLGTATSGNDILQILSTSDSPDGTNMIEVARGTNNVFRVDADGDVFADGAYTGPADFAEMFPVSTGAVSVEPGDVVTLDPSNPRSVIRAVAPRSTLVVGIYSTNPGFVGSERSWESDEVGLDGEPVPYKRADMAVMYDEVPVAIIGIVPCKVTAESGSIGIGDLLVTSSRPGHAMRDADPRIGTVLGKALEPLASGTGVIMVLVTLQ